MISKPRKYTNKKIAIFKGALNLIAKNGFDNAPTAEIAKKAGVGIGTIYWYFKSKRQLIDEVFKYVDEEMSNAITKNSSPDSPLQEQFTLLCKNLITFSFDNPQLISFFRQYVNSPYGTEIRKKRHFLDGNSIHSKTVLYPFYELFNKVKNKRGGKVVPNILLFILIYGSLSNFIRDIRLGIIKYDEELADKVSKACWDMIKRMLK